MTNSATDGPRAGLTNRAGVGLVSESCHHVTFEPPGPDTTEAPAAQESRRRVTGLAGRRIEPGDRLTVHLFPEEGDQGTYDSTFVAPDLLFRDGTRLSDHPVHDQYGTRLTALAQGASKMLFVDQWNHIECDLSACIGQEIESFEIVCSWVRDSAALAEEARFDPPRDTAGPGQASATSLWVDGPFVEKAEPLPAEDSWLDWVDTRRGTHSSGDFSRGNNAPLTSWPNGFCMWTPVTDARSDRWPYEYHAGEEGQTRPRLQGIGISHQPSPWMGDRDQLCFMPGLGAEALGDPRERALPFDHAEELARPDLYSVTLGDAMRLELTPTDHGGLLAVTPRTDGVPGTSVGPDTRLHLVLDSIDDDFGLTWDGEAVTGWVDNGADNGRVRMFVVAVPDAPALGWDRPRGGGPASRALTFRCGDLRGGRLTVRIATSFIGVEQAKRNLELELSAGGAGESSAALWERTLEAARTVWTERLGVIEVEGATPHQRRTLYGCLYRMNLYPNSAHENAGTAEQPRWIHASSVLPMEESTPTETGAQVCAGLSYVNNGFWDTYRTIWPALSLLYPQLAAEMIEGFIQQYREGGWVARWSSPGYADLMTGTSSDVAFADAQLRGVPLVDPLGTYEAGLKNATVAPPHPAVGRKGMDTSVFTGYVDSSVDESVSWALEGYINDHALAAQASALADLAEQGRLPDADASRLREEAAYLRARCLNYVHLFDPDIGFFQGRTLEGPFAVAPEDFDPCVWGGDYTETNGWNFAFHVAHDPAGLSWLHGGPEGLRSKLDAFFALPETGDRPGTYPGVIHEMREARAVRMGQYGFSNQPAHHIAHMYAYAQDRHSTEAIVHEVLRRLFVGEQIGQGYPGDEDNGEMSAWYVLNALGLHPLRVGSPEWALGSPLYERAHVRPLGAEGFEVHARDWTPESVYVDSVALVTDGGRRTIGTSSIAHADLAGATLEFTMADARPADGSRPGVGPAPSVTAPGEAPRPLVDVARAVRIEDGPEDAQAGTAPLASLVDDTSTTVEHLVPSDGETPGISLVVDLREAVSARFLTLTSGQARHRDPSAVTVSGRTADGTWVTLRPRSEVRFAWPRQTVPLLLEAHPPVSAVRLHLEGPAEGIDLAELEVLATSA